MMEKKTHIDGKMFGHRIDNKFWEVICAEHGIDPHGKEPLPILKKVDRNDVYGDSSHLFKVKKPSEKTDLPTRGSSLAAGYDLSNAVDLKVPAKGKALIRSAL